jgi:hypothetical protein
VNSIHFRTDSRYTDPVTGIYLENRTPLKIDHTSQPYLKASIQRLEIISDRRLKNREAICGALREYGYALLDEQREALERRCK